MRELARYDAAPRSQGSGCMPALGCGLVVFSAGLLLFILLCLVLKGLFQ